MVTGGRASVGEQVNVSLICFFFFSSRRRHTRLQGDWSSDVCSSDLGRVGEGARPRKGATLESVTRRLRPTLDSRPRQALDGTTKVVLNPRISAGSTEIGRASCRERV